MFKQVLHRRKCTSLFGNKPCSLMMMKNNHIIIPPTPTTTHAYHTTPIQTEQKKKKTKFKSFLLREDKMTLTDRTLIKTHVQNYKKIQKQQLKLTEKESDKSERSTLLNKQLSRLGISKSQLRLGHLTTEDYDYLMKHRREISGNEEFKSQKTATTVSSLLLKKFNNGPTSSDRTTSKQHRFSVIFKRTLDNILSDPSVNKDERMRRCRVTNVFVSRDFRTITVKWMLIRGYMHAMSQLNRSDRNMFEKYTQEKMEMEEDDVLSDQSGPEIYKLEKLNHLLTQASGFLSSHVTQTLGLKYAPTIVFSPIVTNVQELELAPLSIQQKYESILELKRTYEIMHGEYDPVMLLNEQLECDEFLADRPLKKKKVKMVNGVAVEPPPKFTRRRRPMGPLTF